MPGQGVSWPNSEWEPNRPGSEQKSFLINNDVQKGLMYSNCNPTLGLMIRRCIAIIDDDEAVRLSTAELLERLGFDVQLFRSGDAFLESARLDGISCILLDLQMPGRDGLAVLRELAQGGHPPPTLVLTAHGGIPAAVEAIKLGAHDFMEKPYDAELLLKKIDEALQQPASGKGAPDFNAEAAALIAGLSARQRQVLQGIVRGLQNKIIAYELDLSIRTVEAYRAQLLERLGARGTADAVRLAIAAGFIEEPAFPQFRRPANG